MSTVGQLGLLESWSYKRCYTSQVTARPKAGIWVNLRDQCRESFMYIGTHRPLRM